MAYGNMLNQTTQMKKPPEGGFFILGVPGWKRTTDTRIRYLFKGRFGERRLRRRPDYSISNN